MTTRTSTETDRRHLLAPSIAPSESASRVSNPDSSASSFISQTQDNSGNRTPRATSPAASANTTRRATLADGTSNASQQPYRGFPSQAAYLAALREWAEEKKYISYDRGLTGFYGQTTMQEYARRPSVNLNMGIKDKWRARKARKEGVQGERRATVA